jgi:osmotically-inducible protein OsmY
MAPSNSPSIPRLLRALAAVFVALALPSNVWASDAVMERAILAELRDDRHLDAAGVRVTATNGIVELSGTVGTLVSKERAARVAGVVRGVRVIVNRIQRKLTRRPDADVTRDVRQALRREPATAQMPISVRARKGVVTLTGSISSWTEQELAERVASSVRGVRFCVNNLTTRGAPRRTAETIAADVRSRLGWEPLLTRSELKVVVKNAVVWLYGTTGGNAERSRAVASGWVKGVRAVDGSGISIVTSNRPDENVRERNPSDLEIATAIQDAIAYFLQARPSKITVRVVGGVATLDGVAETFSDKQAIEELAASAVGVNDVKSGLRGPWWRPTPPPPAPRPPAPRKRGRQGRR